MATITSSGIGSGLDINGIVEQLMSIERRPIVALEQRKSTVQTQISAFGQVKSALATLQAAVKRLDDPSVRFAAAASVSEGAGFTATASAGAATGTHEIGVQRLAQAQRVATNATEGFNPGAGTLTISAGGQSVEIDFTGGTLEDLRTAINDQAGSLVRASIVDNGGVRQLVLTGAQTGKSQAFSLTGTGGLEELTFDPNPEDPPPTDPSSSLYLVQAAQDAQITFDGLTVTRPSNTIEDLIPGVTIELRSVTAEQTARLTVKRDDAALKEAMQSFVDAYNAVNNTLHTLSYYDPETRTAGPLSGDASVRTIQSQLRNSLNSLTGSGPLRNFTDLGLSFDDKGALSLDEARFAQALQNTPEAVNQMLVGTDAQPGLARRLAPVLEANLQTGGLLDARVQGLTARVTLIDQQKERLESQLERIEQNYRRQFNAMDKIVGQYASLGSYLQQQFDALMASTKK
ncbi:flagellar filament capping protein FliD [Tepidiphilus baoligensis]|uniref:Flagellar hook-associated protein 2 n=1 Tax=Tepidiphilus baoligensis TaxID=2698687 RepID=A0ABX1QLB8_9PROT|nr:flagellar filament capping protein FliD [Tepidiphilus baoligensis]NMH16682.1 flagellar filament capping protein FliD [Tepidiphilus baoligensis]